jgi:hypothetical protein
MASTDQVEESASAPSNNDEKENVTPNNNVDDAVLGGSVSRASLAPYTVFTENQKRHIVFTASWAGFFSPVSSQIYFPALNTLARDLNVSNSLINLTLTSYIVSYRDSKR